MSEVILHGKIPSPVFYPLQIPDMQTTEVKDVPEEITKRTTCVAIFSSLSHYVDGSKN